MVGNQREPNYQRSGTDNNCHGDQRQVLFTETEDKTKQDREKIIDIHRLIDDWGPRRKGLKGGSDLWCVLEPGRG